MRWTRSLALALCVWFPCTCRAHFGMLLPEESSGRKGETLTLTYQWGHPFEHQLFDAPAPRSVLVLTPDNQKADLTGTVRRVLVPAGEDKQVAAYRFRFTPRERGDYVFVLEAPPIWLEEDRQFVQDTVKVVLHVQAQKGWDSASRADFELVPLTRPYGLEPGMVFQAQVQEASAGLERFRPLAGAPVEVERYNARAPQELPPDEQITRTARTDPVGVATVTLTDPGWWCLTVERDGGTRERAGREYPLRQRCILWVFVAEKGGR